MDDERIARALNLLGENRDLFATDREVILELVGEYFDDHEAEGNLQPSPPTIIDEYS